MAEQAQQTGSTNSHRIARITLDETHVVRRSPEVEHERAVAIADLLESNRFSPLGEGGDDAAQFNGPYSLDLRITPDNRLLFDIHQLETDNGTTISLPIAPFRRIVKDYFLICDSYYKAIQSGNHAQVEAIDMGRRGVHNEGSELLLDLLKGKANADFETARRLFTLICVLHIR